MEVSWFELRFNHLKTSFLKREIDKRYAVRMNKVLGCLLPSWPHPSNPRNYLPHLRDLFLHICLVSSSFLHPPHFPSIWIFDSQVLSGANWPDLLSDPLALSNLERLMNSQFVNFLTECIHPRTFCCELPHSPYLDCGWPDQAYVEREIRS